MGPKKGIAQRKRKEKTKRTEDRSAYNEDRKAVHRTTKGLARIDVDDDDEQQAGESSGINPGRNSPEPTLPDINQVPVTIYIRADATSVIEDNAKPLQLLDIPITTTSLFSVESYAKLFTVIEDHPTLSTTLSTIYNLDLGEHKQAYLSFTDEHGARHTAPLAKYVFPDVLGDGKDAAGKLVASWKAKVESGALEHTPWCNCARHEDMPSQRGRHGVEVVEVLKSDKVAARCKELHELVGELEKEKAKGEQLESELERLQLQVDGLTEAVVEKTALLEAHGIEEDEEESDEEGVSEYEE